MNIVYQNFYNEYKEQIDEFYTLNLSLLEQIPNYPRWLEDLRKPNLLSSYIDGKDTEYQTPHYVGLQTMVKLKIKQLYGYACWFENANGIDEDETLLKFLMNSNMEKYMGYGEYFIPQELLKVAMDAWQIINENPPEVSSHDKEKYGLVLSRIY